MTKYTWPDGRVAFDDDAGHNEANVTLVHFIRGSKEYGFWVCQEKPFKELGEVVYGNHFGTDYQKFTTLIAGIIGTTKFTAKWSS